MNFTKINPYEDVSYWISGIYKIVSYRAGEFHAYYMPDHYKNWGDHPEPETDNGKYGTCWSTLKKAKEACERHARNHQPKPATVKRAAEVMAHLLTEREAA